MRSAYRTFLNKILFRDGFDVISVDLRVGIVYFLPAPLTFLGQIQIPGHISLAA